MQSNPPALYESDLYSTAEASTYGQNLLSGAGLTSATTCLHFYIYSTPQQRCELPGQHVGRSTRSRKFKQQPVDWGRHETRQHNHWPAPTTIDPTPLSLPRILPFGVVQDAELEYTVICSVNRKTSTTASTRK